MNIRIIPLLLTLFMWLTACRPAADVTEISLMIFGDPAERQAYLNLVTAFHDQQPAIRVQVTHIPSPADYRTRLATEFAAGDPPDISLMNYRRYAAFAANDLLEPIGPFLDQSELIQPGDFYSLPLHAFTWQGTLMCLPQNISSLVVYYNKSLFAAVGLPEPSANWTWEEFVQVAQALTHDSDGDGQMDQYGLGVAPSLYRLSPFIWQNEAPLVDDLVSPTRLTLTRPPALAALQWFVDLRQVHGVVPNRLEEVALDSESRFIAGRTAMFLNSRRGTPTYREIESFSWDVAPLPQGKKTAGILHSDAYCLSRAAAHKSAAWDFIEFANSPAGQTLIAGSGRTVPSLKAVAESAVFLNPGLPPEHSRVWLDIIPQLQAVPVLSTWEEVEKIASEEIERAFYGDISATDGANLAWQRTEEYFFLGRTPARP